MVDYDEATAIRRATQLVRGADGLNFSVLNAMMFILLIAIAVVAVASVFKGG
jgi:hypothetical protein